MGADASAYLYLGVDFYDVYKFDKEISEYDLHDPKTGQKTGHKGKDIKEYWMNKYTGERFYCNRYELPTEKWTHNCEQEGDDYVIGIQVERIRDDSGGSEWIEQEQLDKARAEFEANIRPLVGPHVEPKLMLNLYWSY